MKIVMFCSYYEPEIAASMYLINDLIEYLVKRNHDVVVLCPTPCRGVSKETRKLYKKKKQEVLLDGKLIIKRFRLFSEPKGLIGRFLRYYFLTWKFFFAFIREKCDALFADSTPPIIGFSFSKIRLFKKTPIIYNVQDVFPDSLISSGIIKHKGLIWKIGRHIENRTYKLSSSIITISDDFRINLQEKKVPYNKIYVAHNWPDLSNVSYVERNKNTLFDKLGLERDKFYAVYSGNIGSTQNIEILVEAAKRLKNVVFVVFGDGMMKDALISEAETLNNLLVFDFQPYNLISEVFSLGDVGLLISKPGVGTSSVPSKTWSYMAAKRPIVASFDTDSDLSRLILTNKFGLVSNPDDVDGFCNNIMAASKMMGDAGFEYLRNNNVKEKSLSIYSRVIESFLDGDSNG